DHDHATGKIRGVLCRFCNALEGMLNKQPERILKLVIYLERKGTRVPHLDKAIERVSAGEQLF
ncbi:MAG: endonuclease domain-containing protein, partial [Tepidisphaeraceae bacterium]